MLQMKIKRTILSFISSLVLVSCLYNPSSTPPKLADPTPDLENSKPPTKQEIYWYTDLDTALTQSIKQNKPLLVYFYATWCKYCHNMDNITFQDENVIKLVNEKYVSLKVDVDNSTLDDEVGIKSYPTLACVKMLSPYEASPKFSLTGFILPNELVNLLMIHANK